MGTTTEALGGISWGVTFALVGYFAGCGVAQDQCRELATEVAAATMGQAWTHVGTGALAGLRALAALGLPMGIVSNSDGSVQSELATLERGF